MIAEASLRSPYDDLGDLSANHVQGGGHRLQPHHLTIAQEPERSCAVYRTGDGNDDGADRLRVGTAGWPGDAGDCDTDVRFERRGDAFRHRTSDRFAHRAVLLQ